MKVAEDKPIKINKRKIDRNPLLNSTISLTAPEKIQFFFVLRPILFKKEKLFTRLYKTSMQQTATGQI